MLELQNFSQRKPMARAAIVIAGGIVVVMAVLIFIHFATSAPKQAHLTQVTPTQAIARCIVGASSIYQIPTDVILGIVTVEGGHSGQQAGPNVNGTYDLGLMQVNSLWVPQLAQLWHVDYNTAYSALRDSGCENVYVGAWILKQKIVETGALYSGIASYHSATRTPGTAYANKVMAAMEMKAPILSR